MKTYSESEPQNHSATVYSSFRRYLHLCFGLCVAVGLACAGAPSAIAACFNEFPIPTANSSPGGITAGPDGNLWFTELDANNIGQITTAGVITEFPIPTANSGPTAITAGPDGNLWFIEQQGNMIAAITTAGTFGLVESIPTLNSSPVGITAGPDGNLWFTEFSGNKIGRTTTIGGTVEFPIPSAPNPAFITAGPDGNLWFTEQAPLANSIGRITTAGAITEFPIPTINSFPDYITAGPDGNLWFTEFDANSIGRITTAGVITEFPIPTASSGPNGITAGPDGNLWFTEQNGNRIGQLERQPLELVNCPSDETVFATTCEGAVAQYSSPTVIGGCDPVSLTCTPQSGSSFPLGSTTVTCIAVDAENTIFACGFTVTVVASADLSISLGATKNPSSTFTYTITVKNSGPTLSCGAVVSDPLPASVGFISATTTQGSLITPAVGATGTLTANLGTLASGASAVVTITVKVLVKGNLTIVNKASVSATTPDPNPANNSATLNTYFFGNKK